MKISEYIEALSKLPPHVLEEDIDKRPWVMFRGQLVMACNFPEPSSGHGVIVYEDGIWKRVGYG